MERWDWLGISPYAEIDLFRFRPNDTETRDEVNRFRRYLISLGIHAGVKGTYALVADLSGGQSQKQALPAVASPVFYIGSTEDPHTRFVNHGAALSSHDQRRRVFGTKKGSEDSLYLYAAVARASLHWWPCQEGESPDIVQLEMIETFVRKYGSAPLFNRQSTHQHAA